MAPVLTLDSRSASNISSTESMRRLHIEHENDEGRKPENGATGSSKPCHFNRCSLERSSKESNELVSVGQTCEFVCLLS